MCTITNSEMDKYNDKLCYLFQLHIDKLYEKEKYRKKRRKDIKYKNKVKKLYGIRKEYPNLAYPVDKDGRYTNNESEIAYYKKIYNSKSFSHYKKLANKKVRRYIRFVNAENDIIEEHPAYTFPNNKSFYKKIF